eukprot:EG_transcript_29625
MFFAAVRLFLLEPLFYAVAFLLPVLSSYQALESKDKDQQRHMLQYWMVFGLLFVVESYIEWFFARFRLGYWVVKIVFVLWIQSPRFGGAQLIYDKVLVPYVGAHEDWLDAQLCSAKEHANAAAQLLGDVGVKVLATAKSTATVVAAKAQEKAPKPAPKATCAEKKD